MIPARTRAPRCRVVGQRRARVDSPPGRAKPAANVSHLTRQAVPRTGWAGAGHLMRPTPALAAPGRSGPRPASAAAARARHPNDGAGRRRARPTDDARPGAWRPSLCLRWTDLAIPPRADATTPASAHRRWGVPAVHEPVHARRPAARSARARLVVQAPAPAASAARLRKDPARKTRPIPARPGAPAAGLAPTPRPARQGQRPRKTPLFRRRQSVAID